MSREEKIRDLIGFMIRNPDHGITFFASEPCKYHLTDSNGKTVPDEFAVYGRDILEALNIKEK